MKKQLMTQGLFAVVGLLLISSAACSFKWLQSGSDSESYEQGIPDLSKRGMRADASEGGALRGFEPLKPGQSPSEERLSRGSVMANDHPSDREERKRAELRREEAAAVAAGLKDVYFHYDRWSISDEGVAALSLNAAWLKENPKAILRVEGHCDERGTQEYNLVLGEKRAKAARKFLLDLGVNAKQVAIVSYGKDQPFCFGHDESCYKQNRRGHMLLRQK